MTATPDAPAIIQRIKRIERVRTASLARRLLSLSPKRTILLQAAARLSGHTWLAPLVFGGSMLVTPPDTPSMWIARYGYFEPDVMALIDTAVPKNGVFVDVGAHLGFFSLWASYLGGPATRVYAVEPTPRTAELLRRNTAYLGDRFVLHECAALDRSGSLEFTDFGPGGAAFNGASEAVGNGERSLRKQHERDHFTVTCEPLDRLLGDVAHIDCIKIDAEGSEGAVLDGAEALLRRHRPHIILETGDFSRPGRSRAVLDHVLALGDYSAYAADQDLRPVPHELLDVYPYGNILLSPLERLRHSEQPGG